MRKIQRLAYWLGRRKPRYILARLVSLLQRYGLTPAKGERRVLECVELLARYGGQPTFPTPGRVVRHNAAFCRTLQEKRVELAIHGYDHVDFTGLSPHEAVSQFERAARAFASAGIRFDGFRCPYLSFTDELLQVIPPGMFRYSSNKAITWSVVPAASMEQANAVFHELSQFYNAEPSDARVAVPRRVGDLVEIPASLPDDIQIYDGLKLGKAGIQKVWSDILRETYRRGELFAILFHPELYEHCAPAFASILSEARDAQPAIWVTQLRAVSDWWREKAGFRARVSDDAIHLDCSPRATVLVRNLETEAPTHPWDGDYHVLEGRVLPLDGHLPFVGLANDVPEETRAFLSDQGYLLGTGEAARRCALYLDHATTSRLNEVQLVECVESSAEPLVRFGRWPNEAKSGVCITGDLDTLSLVDYLLRLFTI